MTPTDNDNFANNLLNTSNFTTLSQLSKLFSFKFEHCDTNRTLSAFVVAILLFLILIKLVLRKRRPKHGYISYADTLPHMRWIPFVNLPILDSLYFWYKVRQDGVTVLERIRLQCGADSTWSFGYKTIVALSDPHTIQKILSSTNPGHLSKAKLFYDHLFTRVLKDGLLVSKVDIWSTHRKIVSPVFKYKSLVTCHKYIYDGAKKLAKTACNSFDESDAGVLCNKKMREIIDVNAFEIASQIVMGSESCNFPDEKKTAFHEAFKIGLKLAMDRFYHPEWWIPPLCWLNPDGETLEKCMQTGTEITYQITDDYRKKLENKARKRLVGINCQNNSNMNDKDESIGIKSVECLVETLIKSSLSRKEISDEVATFLIAGHETTKVALDLLIFQLARHKEHQEKCQAEVDKLFNSGVDKEDGYLGMEDFSQLKYLEMCILESLRITPTVPASMRELQEPLRIDDEKIIPAGQYVLVMTWAIHRNPSIYPNPETFDPNRFLPENVKQRHPYSFIPFSMGMRNCVGWKLALMEMKVIMAWILRYFEMDTTDEPNDVKLFFGVTVVLERPYNVTFKKRT